MRKVERRTFLYVAALALSAALVAPGCRLACSSAMENPEVEEGPDRAGRMVRGIGKFLWRQIRRLPPPLYPGP